MAITLATTSADYWYRWGFSVAGPVGNAFAGWIKRRAEAVQAERIFLFARDGWLPNEIFSIRPAGVPAHYTFASRRLFLVPALEELDRTTLNAVASMATPGTRAADYWRRLGIHNAAVEELLAERFAPDERIWLPPDRKRLETFFRDAHPLFLDDVRTEKKILRGYLESIGLLGGNSKPLIADVGWKASSQRFLEKAFPELRGTPGAYFGLNAHAYRNGNMRALLFEYEHGARMRNMVMSCVEIPELMFSAPHPTVHKIAVRDGAFEPVYEPLRPEEERRLAIVRRIHEGALDFTRRGGEIDFDREDAARLLAPILLRPTAEEVEHFGSLPHALGIGTSHYETILPAHPPGNPFRILVQHLGKSRTRLYWPAGLARAIELRHGRLRALAARPAIAFTHFAYKTYERVLELLRK